MSTVRATLYTVAHKNVTVNIMSISSANHNRFGYFWNSLTHVILLPAEVPCIVGRSSTSETDSACMVSTIVLAVYDHSLQAHCSRDGQSLVVVTEWCSPRGQMASMPKFWPRPQRFGLSLASISLSYYVIWLIWHFSGKTSVKFGNFVNFYVVCC